MYSADNSSNVTHDQPKIGVSADKVAFSFNDFLNAAFFQGASTWVFGKTAMLAGASSIPGEAVGPDSRRVSIVPAIELTSTSTEFMAYNNSDCGYSGCNAGYTFSDPRVLYDAISSRWFASGVAFVTPSYGSVLVFGVSDSSDPATPPGDTAVRPCPRLIQVSTAGPTVNQNFDLGSTGNDLYYPAVHVDSAGDMYVVYNISSTSQDVSVRLTGQPAGSAPQFVVPAQTIQAGQGLYTCANRWGDYSGSAIDPSNPSSVWLAAEYAGASSTNCNWATFISQVTFVAPTTADFSLSASPASQSVVAGNSTSYSVTITPTGGFNSAVTLSVSGLPPGANGTFSPNNAVMTSSTLSVTTTTGTPPGSYPLTITGTSGTLTHTTSVTLTVNAPPLADFSLGASPSSQMISRHGASVMYGVTITPSNGFTGTVTLSVSGLPSRASASFSPNPAPASSTLTVSTSNGTTAGSYTLVITGVSGGLTHTTMVTLVVT